MELERSAGARSIPGERTDATHAGHFEALVFFVAASAAALFSTGVLYSMNNSPNGGRCPSSCALCTCRHAREALLPGAGALQPGRGGVELDRAPGAVALPPPHACVCSPPRGMPQGFGGGGMVGMQHSAPRIPV